MCVCVGGGVRCLWCEEIEPGFVAICHASPWFLSNEQEGRETGLQNLETKRWSDRGGEE